MTFRLRSPSVKAIPLCPPMSTFSILSACEMSTKQFVRLCTMYIGRYTRGTRDSNDTEFKIPLIKHRRPLIVMGFLAKFSPDVLDSLSGLFCCVAAFPLDVVPFSAWV